MTVAFSLAIAPLAVHFQTNNLRNDRVVPLYLDNTMRGVPQNSLNLTSDWEISSPWLYFRFVEGVRPDVVIVQTQLLHTSWYLDHLEPLYPALMRGAEPKEPVAPHGLLYSYAEGADDVELDFSGLLGEVPLDEVGVHTSKNYSAMLTARAIYADRLGDITTTQQKLDMALRLDPDNAQVKRLRSALH